MLAIFILPLRTWKMWGNVQTKSGSLFLSIKVAHLVTLHSYYTAYLSLTINRKITTITTIYLCCPGDKDRQALVKHLKRMLTFATWIFQFGQKWHNNQSSECWYILSLYYHKCGCMFCRAGRKWAAAPATVKHNREEGVGIRRPIKTRTKYKLDISVQWKLWLLSVLTAEGSFHVLGLCTPSAQLFCKVVILFSR